MSFSVEVIDRASPVVARLAAALSPRELGTVGGQAVANRLRTHFQELQNSRPNKEGWKRQNFWDQVRRSVQRPNVTATGAEVSINHVGIALRLLGGTVRPVSAKFLTIPASSEAYGRRAREFNDLEFKFMINRWGRVQPALVVAFATQVSFGKKRKDGTRKVKSTRESSGGTVAFWLTKKATFKPDPSVLPTSEQLATAAVQAAESYLQRKIKGGPNG